MTEIGRADAPAPGNGPWRRCAGSKFMRAPYSRTLSDLIDELADRHGDAVAVIDRDETISFAELNRRSLCVAGALRACGIRRGDRVATLMPNRVEWLVSCFAAAYAGATLVPFSTWSTAEELAWLLADSEARILLCANRFGDREFGATTAALFSGASIPHWQHLVIVGGDAPGGTLRFADMLAAPPIDRMPPGEGPSAMDVALLLYTSGSSSRPKGVQMRHHGMIENGFNIGERQGLVAGDRVFLSVPLFWAYGGVNAMPAALTHGAALVLQERFEPRAALDLLERHACTAIYTLPGMTRALLDQPGFAPERTASLSKGLTIGTPQDVTAAVELGVENICNIYGSSETYGNCCVTWSHWPLERRAGCQGEPLPGMEMRIVDLESGRKLPPGETGAVEVRGMVTPGYAGESARLNETAFTPDGFFRMGDLGMIQADGTFAFVGRHSEMIKTGGINVSPVEIEEVLLRHPAVGEAGVVGAPDPVKGERIVAFVVPRPGATPDGAVLAAHCRRLMSSYKVPDLFVIQGSLPTTATGKLMRRDLRTLAEAALPKAAANG